jgi:hypothetical protein
LSERGFHFSNHPMNQSSIPWIQIPKPRTPTRTYFPLFSFIYSFSIYFYPSMFFLIFVIFSFPLKNYRNFIYLFIYMLFSSLKWMNLSIHEFNSIATVCNVTRISIFRSLFCVVYFIHSLSSIVFVYIQGWQQYGFKLTWWWFWYQKSISQAFGGAS